MYDGDFVSTVRRMLDRVDGAYALEIICADEPDKIIVLKKKTIGYRPWQRGKLRCFRYSSNH